MLARHTAHQTLGFDAVGFDLWRQRYGVNEADVHLALQQAVNLALRVHFVQGQFRSGIEIFKIPERSGQVAKQH